MAGLRLSSYWHTDSLGLDAVPKFNSSRPWTRPIITWWIIPSWKATSTPLLIAPLFNNASPNILTMNKCYLALFLLNEIQDSRNTIIVLSATVGEHIDERVRLRCFQGHFDTSEGHFRTVTTPLGIDAFQILIEGLRWCCNTSRPNI